MRKLNLLLVIIILFAISCKKQSISDITKETEKQPPLSCGMEEASARIPMEFLNKMRSKARIGTVKAPSLLVYLQFEGATVRYGPNYLPSYSGLLYSLIIHRSSVNCPAARLTEAQKSEIVQLVKDDFSPFNIEVTTSPDVYNSYNPQNRHVCIITTLPNIIGMEDKYGVSPWYGEGVRSANDPTFVFANMFGNNDKKEIADVISHEVGHSLGLGHQHLYTESIESNCHFLNEYHRGIGTGPLSFTPIMGFGLRKRISNWYAQPCQTQNDFVFLNNQVELKEDDFPNNLNLGERTFAKSGTRGVLGIAGDVDFLYISPHSPKPVYITSDNIDIKVTMYNAGGQLISVHDDPDDIGITIPQALGVCYLKVEAVSNVNMSSQFMTGEYLVSY